MSYFNWILLLFVLALINAAVGFSGVKNFLSRHTAIDSPRTFEEFKQMVRKQMIQALVQAGFLLPMGFLGGYGIVTHRISTQEFIAFLLFNGVVFMLGQMGKPNEVKARSMKVMDPSMEDHYHTICESWLHKPLPDF